MLGLLFRGQFRERLGDLRKIKQWIVAEAIGTPRSVEDNSFCRTAKRSQRLSIARCGQDTDESARALSRWNVLQFAQHPRVVGLVIGIFISLLGTVSGVTGRVYARRSLESVNLQTRVVSDNSFSRNTFAIRFGLLARIGFEGKTILYD